MDEQRRVRSGRDKSSGRRRATMAVVARMAGVSTMTVSRVLRQPELVQPETRTRVEEAMARIGYVPDLVAAALSTQRSDLIALVVPTIASSIFADAIKGASDTASAAGMQIVVAETGYMPRKEEDLVATLLGRRPDGLVLVGVAHTQRTTAMLTDSGIPIVEIWDVTPTPIDSLVSVSNDQACYAMTEALIAKGYREVAFVGAGDRDLRSQKRFEGYSRAMEANGLRIPKGYVLTDWVNVRSGVQFARDIHASRRIPEALFFVNDAVAAGAMLEFQRLGCRVPSDVAVAGFGGFEYSEFLIPPLSTVDVARYAIGKAAVEIIIARNNGADPVVQETGFTIVLRGST